MARARIFRPARTAMQQGRAKTKAWVLEFEPAKALRPDNLMGWAGGGDTNRQVRLTRSPTAKSTASPMTLRRNTTAWSNQRATPIISNGTASPDLGGLRMPQPW
jgi:hypothetical protein